MNHIRKTLILAISLLCLTPLRAQNPQKGKASYYSKRATGARTSSGERLHHDSLTCAHRTHPFGTRLKVTNPANGKSVIVRVTDRGPFGRGRIIDLSWRAAKELGILVQGVAMVSVAPVNTTIVPFRPNENIELPELDFSNNNFTDCIRPEWYEMKKTIKERNHTIPKKRNIQPAKPQIQQKTQGKAEKANKTNTNQEKEIDELNTKQNTSRVYSKRNKGMHGNKKH
ncbi:septal ring lytic transglycosylase RlpA family protein [Prevotella sp. PTAC]|uniref:septal ring lytic transglycosylase RlpA family protein n=1 Tax=Prevotella sp. PTAC TaxID=2736295 RepID=UPI001552EA39|nr:septal ring lytic transglycosylase RlpA family protein [Prevotella sp. PTAC]